MALRLKKKAEAAVDGGGEEGEKKKEALKAIFLCAERASQEGTLREHVWHQLRFRLKKKKRSRLRYVLTSVDRAPPPLSQVKGMETSFVSVGSVIYALGGTCLPDCGKPPPCHKHGSMLFCDTNTTPMRWTQARRMLCPRVRPAAAAYKGKIYVFGGGPIVPQSPSDKLFGEVFDTERQAWQHLPNPPVDLYLAARISKSHHFCTAGCSLNGRDVILVHIRFFEKLYAYDVDGQSWTVVESDYGINQGHMVVLDDVLYTIGCNRHPHVSPGLFAYDLVRRKFLSIQHAPPFELYFLRATLLDLGNGVFAVANFGVDISSPRYSTFCLKFRVVKVPPSDGDATADPTIILTDQSSLSWLLPDDGGVYDEGYISAPVFD